MAKAVKKSKSKSVKKTDTRKNHKTNPYFQSGTEERAALNIGNNFWTKRTKHGRDRIFANPAAMLEAFEEYMAEKIANPWHRAEYKGKKMVYMPTIMPFTWDGFCIFLGVAPSYFTVFRHQLNESETALPEHARLDFLATLELIERTIRDQKYNGAAAGYFKENLVSYDLLLRKDNPVMEVTGSGVSITVSDNEDKTLLEELRKKLKE